MFGCAEDYKCLLSFVESIPTLIGDIGNCFSSQSGILHLFDMTITFVGNKTLLCDTQTIENEF